MVRETERLWPSLKCPEATCEGTSVICHDHAEPRTWRHLDAFGKRTEILCSLPRARCKGCDKVWTVPAPWEGKGKHFTKEFEAFSLTLMQEMPVKRAGEILGEGDKQEGIPEAQALRSSIITRPCLCARIPEGNAVGSIGTSSGLAFVGPPAPSPTGASRWNHLSETSITSPDSHSR